MTTNNATATSKPLTPAQQRQFLLAVNGLTSAEAQRVKAEAVADAARQGEAIVRAQVSNFVNYCAEELGVGNWAFNQSRLCFEQVPPPDSNGEKEG